MEAGCENMSRDGVSFIEDKILDTHRTIIIDKDVEVVGKNFIIKDDIIIMAKSVFINVNFNGGMIYIKKAGNAEFHNCCFEARNELTTVKLIEGSGTRALFKDCTFINYNTAIEANDNYIETAENNIFQGCRKAIAVYDIQTNIDVFAVNRNVMMSDKDSIFIESDRCTSESGKAIEASRNISKANNMARIVCSLNNVKLSDTYMYYVKNGEELSKAIGKAENGNLINLRHGQYKGSYTIDSSIMLTGEEGTVILPDESCKDKAAIVINASNTVVENLTILSSSDLCFRDGIGYSLQGGSSCRFKNITINKVSRRGISLWGRNTKDTFIEGCRFSNIDNDTAVSIKGNTEIVQCKFDSCLTGILKKYNDNLSVKKCEFLNLETLLKCRREFIGTCRFKGNEYNGINIFLSQIQ